MGRMVMVMGESGSGKSASLRNFAEEEIGIFNVCSKDLPFRKKLPVINHATYDQIKKALTDPKKKVYVIDDSQYLMAFESMNRASETGYNKFTEIALHFYELLKLIERLPDDVIVYFLHHTEMTESGRIKPKTIGKMLDNQLTLEGLFGIVLLARTDGQRHWFETQSDGFTTAKSPMDMFPERETDNDLKAVDTVIRQYYEIK